MPRVALGAPAELVSVALWRSVLALLAFLSQRAVCSESEDGAAATLALQHLQRTGVERVWPAFVNNTSLLTFAFSDQQVLPNPTGASPNGVRLVSLSPRVYVIEDFMTSEECDFLRATARYRLWPAEVLENSDNWYNIETQTRNNEQVWLTPREEKGTPLLRHVLKRIHRLARVPDDFSESLQVGRYNVTTKYEVHVDSDPELNVARPATLITYLNDVEKGGDTLFPMGRKDCGMAWRTHPKTQQKMFGASLCCDTPELDAPDTVRVSPKKGRAVLFFSHFADGRLDRRSAHTGCPVIEGEKWIAQRWLRFEPYSRISFATPDGNGWDPRFDGPPLAGAMNQVAEPNLRTLSSKHPRVYLEERFLSPEQCDLLVEHAKPRLQRNASGEAVVESAWVSSEEEDADEKLAAIAEKSALLARFSRNASRGVRIARSGVGWSELPHLDSSPPASTYAVTVLVFLNDVGDGGDVVFPQAAPDNGRTDCGKTVEELEICCAKAKLKVRPRKGDALLIFSHSLDGRLDKASLHASCPLRRGELWVAERRLAYDVAVLHEAGSEAEDARPVIVFVNLLQEVAKTYWYDPNEKREVFMGDIEAGLRSDFVTSEGHVFKVRSPSGDFLGEVRGPSAGRRKYLIGGAGNRVQDDTKARTADGGAAARGYAFKAHEL